MLRIMFIYSLYLFFIKVIKINNDKMLGMNNMQTNGTLQLKMALLESTTITTPGRLRQYVHP
jgi:hypothetical protein